MKILNIVQNVAHNFRSPKKESRWICFFGLMIWGDFISRQVKYSRTKCIEINGEIVDTYVVTKPRYGSFGGGKSSFMTVKVEAFNGLDILLSNGEVYKVFVGFNANPYQHYDGEEKIGDFKRIRAVVYDDQHYVTEDFFMTYYRM